MVVYYLASGDPWGGYSARAGNDSGTFLFIAMVLAGTIVWTVTLWRNWLLRRFMTRRTKRNAGHAL
jgi:heme/copper-type cytochrome/quinol oxidase subunit 2